MSARRLIKGGLIRRALLASLALLTACSGHAQDDRAQAGPSQPAFPHADRPVATIVSTQWSTEDVRDRQGEAEIVMDLAQITPGMSVADIGAGEGYYTVRLAARVGPTGRVLAQDIDAGALKRLGARAERDRLGMVSIQKGAPDDPRLPERSFERVFLIHMYHEIAEPYAFLWRLWPALKPGGTVVVVDAERPTERHGTPTALLLCEFETAGFRLVAFRRKPELAGYYAEFAAADTGRPEPGKMRSCSAAANAQTDRPKGR